MSGEHIGDIPAKLPKGLRRGDLILVFALALFLRLALFAASNDQVGTDHVLDNCFDCRLYLNMANSIAEGTDAYEGGYFFFGPGYAYFLALNDIFFDGRIVLILLVNILLSSFSCLLIYLLGMLLTRSYAVSITAALLAAVSYTSIVLSNMVMSDTLYFFLSLAALTIYLKALSTNRWLLYILAGILTGMAALVRSVGQFWPVVMIVIVLAVLVRSDRFYLPIHLRRHTVVKAAVAILIPVVVMTAWMARNDRVHGVFTMAITSANGPANVAAVTLERREGISSKTIMQNWLDEYKESLDRPELSLGDIYRAYRIHTREVIDSLGWSAVIGTYLSLVWENLTEINYLHRALIPRLNDFTIPLEKKIMGSVLHLLCFLLSIFGVIVLIAKHRCRVAIILGTIYLYYAAMIGSFRWQGSRYFFPGQIAWSILVAVSLVFIGRLFIGAGHRMFAKLKDAR